jgi:hypothetical protein
MREGALGAVHANQRSGEKTRAAAVEGLIAFLQAVASGDDAAAVALCSKSLRDALKHDEAIVAMLRELREFIEGLTDFKDESFELHWLRRSAHVTGKATYRERSPATFRYDLELEDREWKLKQVVFETHPEEQSITVGELVKKVVAAVTGRNASEASSLQRPIKVSQSGIYHLPGGRYYETVTATKEFATEAEAKAAGYRRSQRG